MNDAIKCIPFAFVLIQQTHSPFPPSALKKGARVSDQKKKREGEGGKEGLTDNLTSNRPENWNNSQISSVESSSAFLYIYIPKEAAIEDKFKVTQSYFPSSSDVQFKLICLYLYTLLFSQRPTSFQSFIANNFARIFFCGICFACHFHLAKYQIANIFDI